MKPLKLGGVFGVFVVWCFAVVGVGPIVRAQVGVRVVTEAPAGFDRQTNGQVLQAEFALAEAAFAEKHSIADGIGPVYNAPSCADCHENPVIGGNSQVFDVRAGHGRFGWKGQQASLLSFASDMYVNEMGITTPMNPQENTSNGKSVAAFDFVPPGHPTDPDDGDNDDLDGFALFMRSTMAPPRDTALAATPAAQAGEALFNQIGCSICHVPSITTAPPGTFLNLNVFASGGVQTYVVSAALGDKIIRPFSDFLLHDIGTGDGVAQGSPGSRNQVRTVPLWGLRTHSRFMHDGLSFTMNEAILRHGGEASLMTFIYQLLSPTQRNNILTFLRSL